MRVFLLFFVVLVSSVVAFIEVSCRPSSSCNLLIFSSIFTKNEERPVNFVGTPNEIPSDDKYAHELLSSNLERLVTGSGLRLELVGVKSILRKVVAGWLYEISGTFMLGGHDTECIVSIWSRPWYDDPIDQVHLKATCGSDTLMAKDFEEPW